MREEGEDGFGWREAAREPGAYACRDHAEPSDLTTRDLAMVVQRHGDGKGQFEQVMPAVRGSPELVTLGKEGRGEDRMISRDMVEPEQRLERATGVMANRDRGPAPAVRSAECC